MQKQFKNILPIAVGSIAAGETMAIDVDASGLPVNGEYRKRVKDNGLIEVAAQQTPAAEVKTAAKTKAEVKGDNNV